MYIKTLQLRQGQSSHEANLEIMIFEIQKRAQIWSIVCWLTEWMLFCIEIWEQSHWECTKIDLK